MLIDQLKSDLTTALKAGEALKVETLRGLLAAIHNAEIEKRTKSGEDKLTEEEAESVLQKEAKKRKEAAEVYGRAGRSELEGKEKNELEIIASYLPPPLSGAEIEAIVGRAVEEHGKENFGKVMQAVMTEVGSRAGAGDVSKIVKRALGQ